MKRISGLALAVAAGMLAGCQSVSSMYRETASSTVETVPGKLINVVDQYRLPPTGGKGVGQLALTPALSNPGERLPNGQPLERYAGGIVEKLLARYDGPKSKIEVFITTSSSYTASINSSGALSVPQGLLVNARSEDELAFVLAHEISHALLNHTAKEDMEKDADAVTGAALMGTAFLNKQLGGVNAAGGVGGRLNSVSTGIMAAAMVNKLLLSPSWSRAQEDEADLLAADLLFKAALSQQEAHTAFERMQDDILRQEEKVKAEHKKLEDHVSSLAASGRVSEAFDIVNKKFSEAPAVLIKAVLDAAASTHRSPLKRRDDFAAYLDREYGDEPMRAKRTAEYERAVFRGAALKALSKPILATRAQTLVDEKRLDEARNVAMSALDGPNDRNPDIRKVLYQVALAEGDVGGAIKHLDLASQDPRAPVEIFDLLFAAYVEEGRPASALTVLDRMVQRFPNRRSATLPLRLRLLLETGRDADAGQVMAACAETRRPEIYGQCTAVQADWQAGRSAAGPRRT